MQVIREYEIIACKEKEIIRKCCRQRLVILNENYRSGQR